MIGIGGTRELRHVDVSCDRNRDQVQCRDRRRPIGGDGRPYFGEPRLVRPTLVLPYVWHPGFLPRLRRLHPEGPGRHRIKLLIQRAQEFDQQNYGEWP